MSLSDLFVQHDELNTTRCTMRSSSQLDDDEHDDPYENDDDDRAKRKPSHASSLVCILSQPASCPRHEVEILGEVLICRLQQHPVPFQCL